VYSIVSKRNYSVSHELRKLNLLKNKHIPSEYLIDSENNRLALLAGIIDSDGHAYDGSRTGYEVTQKRKNLASDIRRLALDLGFYASMRKKKATMKREDGSIYESDVYRVMIYGNDLWRVPCKIKRKKYQLNMLLK